ncbi:hypothetical protein EKK58_04605 [Candidatus Dependentiae bacterium]|nr:MAG: hypothetical protein EKK58_04605 [Candidatus Dependentiae bacterium]
MKNIKTILLSLSLIGAMSLMADPNPIKTVGWIPWIGGGVGSLVGGLTGMGLGAASWLTNTVTDTTFTFSDGVFGKDTAGSKLLAGGIIWWCTTGLIKQVLRYQTIVKSVEADFKKGLKNPETGLRNKTQAYWTSEAVNNANNSDALETLAKIKQHYIFKPLAYTGLADHIEKLMNHHSFKNEYDQSKYIKALNNASWALYANNKLTWVCGLDEVKDQILSLYIRICLCERAVKNKAVTDDILQKLGLK